MLPATVTATAVVAATVAVPTVTAIPVSSTAKADAEGEPIVDHGRLIDGRYDLIGRLGVDGLGAGVALPVGIEIVAWRASRLYLRNGRRAGPRSKGQSDHAR
jgi:hypothetical protein